MSAPVSATITAAVATEIPGTEVTMARDGKAVGPASTPVVNVTPPASHCVQLPDHLSNSPRPVASDLNLVPGDLKGNLSIVAICVNGSISIYNNARTVDVVIDVVRWHS